MVEYRMLGVSIAESWFLPEVIASPVDLYYVQQAPRPLPGFDITLPFTTLVVDLTKDEQSLLGDMHKKTRYKINRADRQDNLAYVVDEECNIQRFVEVFLHCERFRKVSSLNMERLIRYKRQKMLLISYVMAPDVEMPLSAHCFLLFQDLIRPIYACILRSADSRDIKFSNFVGRANCFHFWKDMLHCKKMGITQFDCGGWYQGGNKTLTAVAKFKQGFGGTPRHQFFCIQIRTHKGWFYMLLKRFYFACRGKPQ